MMKRLIVRCMAFLTVLSVLFSFAACDLFRRDVPEETTAPVTNPPTTDPVQPVTDEPSSETEPIVDPPAEDLYASTVDAYVAAYEAGFDEYLFASSDLSEMCVLGGGADAVGFALADLNGDGVPELIVGRRADVYDLYTIDGEGSVVHLFTASERTTCRVGADGVIMQYDEDTSLESVRVYSVIENGTLAFVRRLACTYDEDDNPVWTLSEGETLAEQVISIPEANAIIDAFESMSFSFTLFSSLIES